MSTKIRMARVGAKNDPHYRVVVAEASAPRDGRHIEILGEYHPKRKTEKFKLNQKRIQYWISVGAQPSKRVAKMIKSIKEVA